MFHIHGPVIYNLLMLLLLPVGLQGTDCFKQSKKLWKSFGAWVGRWTPIFTEFKKSSAGTI